MPAEYHLFVVRLYCAQLHETQQVALSASSPDDCRQRALAAVNDARGQAFQVQDVRYICQTPEFPVVKFLN